MLMMFVGVGGECTAAEHVPSGMVVFIHHIEDGTGDYIRKITNAYR